MSSEKARAGQVWQECLSVAVGQVHCLVLSAELYWVKVYRKTRVRLAGSGAICIAGE